MRCTQPVQIQLGEVDIGSVEFDLQSRDDIPQLLRGLQDLYRNVSVRDEIFQLLETIIPAGVDAENGRPGMSLWTILVLGMLRLNLNCDYDRVHELANNHRVLRKMLGHGLVDVDQRYSLQSIKDNVRLFTPSVLDQINQVAVKHAHREFTGETVPLRGRCDSFVVETDVHYPTDINLLYDAIRKTIALTSRLSERYCFSQWRQHEYQQRKVKKLFNIVRKMKRSSAKDERSENRRKTL